MILRLRCTALFVLVLLAVGRAPTWAQSRAAGAIGVLAFEGTRGESGVGVLGAAQITLSKAAGRRLAVEVGLQSLTPFGQVCTLGIPGGCNPRSPASPVWHARVLAGASFTRTTPLYVTVGVGAYGPVGPAGRPATLALGLDTGLGLRLSRHAALEARYLHLQATRSMGGAVPISLVVGL